MNRHERMVLLPGAEVEEWLKDEHQEAKLVLR